MSNAPEARWTLRQLTAEVEALLARNYAAPENGQVRAVPDERAIRYYTTLGLLDRPAAMRGRTALYAPRHLAQLVAIKRMQAVGKSLAEIQRLLPTLDDETLSRVSGVGLPSRTRRRESTTRFWRTPPAVAAPAAPAPYSLPAMALPLSRGATITFTPARAVTDADLDALRNAAAPLLTELARRGLMRATEEDHR